MKKTTQRLPDFSRRSFARTNIQTIEQRVTLLRELVSGIRCGDCSRQCHVYTHE